MTCLKNVFRNRISPSVFICNPYLHTFTLKKKRNGRIRSSHSTLSTLLRARFINELSDACQVFALIANFKATNRTDFLFVFCWRRFVRTELACFKRVSRLLETTRVATEQTFETFTFATFNIYHKFFTSFQWLRIMLGLCRNS